MKITLDGRSTPARACDTDPRSSVASPRSSGLQNTQTSGYMHFTLERDSRRSSGSTCTQASRSSVKVPARAWVKFLENPDWPPSTKLNLQPSKTHFSGPKLWKTLGNPQKNMLKTSFQEIMAQEQPNLCKINMNFMNMLLIQHARTSLNSNPPKHNQTW